MKVSEAQIPDSEAVPEAPAIANYPGNRVDKAHELILEEPVEGKWSTAKTASIAFRCMALAAFVIAVFNSEGVVSASRSVPIEIRPQVEGAAMTWHGWMEKLGTAQIRTALHDNVQEARTRGWPELVWPTAQKAKDTPAETSPPDETLSTDEQAVKSQIQAHVIAVRQNAQLVSCLQSSEFRDEVAAQRAVKEQLGQPGPFNPSKAAIRKDPILAQAAKDICGY